MSAGRSQRCASSTGGRDARPRPRSPPTGGPRAPGYGLPNACPTSNRLPYRGLPHDATAHTWRRDRLPGAAPTGSRFRRLGRLVRLVRLCRLSRLSRLGLQPARPAPAVRLRCRPPGGSQPRPGLRRPGRRPPPACSGRPDPRRIPGAARIPASARPSEARAAAAARLFRAARSAEDSGAARISASSWPSEARAAAAARLVGGAGSVRASETGG